MINIFRRKVVRATDFSNKGLRCLVNAVKMDLTLVDVYIIRNKAYYYFNFRVTGRK